MGLIMKAVGIETTIQYPYLNTSTPIDIATGNFEKGANGLWYLNGGIGPVNGFSGRSGYYKSTIVDSILVLLLEIYPKIEVLKYDTENTTTSLVRYEKMSNGKIDSSAITILTRAVTSFTEFCDTVEKIGQYKLKNIKTFTVSTPFMKGNTTEFVDMLIPTLVDVDSLSELITDVSVQKLTKDGISNSSNNTLDMFEGRVKKRLLSSMVVWARKYGMNFFLTAHVGDKKDIDQYHPTAKQNQWITGQDKIKAVGNNFEYLPNLSFQCLKPEPLIDKSTKMAHYPSDRDNANPELSNADSVDINKTGLKILRCKTNMTGITIPLVMSQHYGLQKDLSNYEYLIDAKDFGFTMKGYNRYTVLEPEVMLHRKSIRKTIKDNYTTSRALELLQQLSWVNRYWNLIGYDFTIPVTAEGFAERIHESSNLTIDDVLESRGCWTYDTDKNQRRYLSLFDICEMTQPTGVSKQVPDDLDVVPKVSAVAQATKKTKSKPQEENIDDIIAKVNSL